MATNPNEFEKTRYADDEEIILGSDDDFLIEYDSGNDQLEIKAGTTNAIVVDTSGDCSFKSSTLSSGSYSATFTDVVNGDTFTDDNAHYSRIGALVTVYVDVVATITAGSTDTQFRISLPVASNFTAQGDLIGSGVARAGTTNTGVQVRADATNDEAIVYFTSISTANHRLTVSFSYNIA